jgi:hypothetical protein
MSKRTKIILIVAAVALLIVGLVIWYRKRGQYTGQLGYGSPAPSGFLPQNSPYTDLKANNALSAGLYVATGVPLFNQPVEKILGWMWHIQFEAMPTDPAGAWQKAKNEALAEGKTEMQWLTEAAAWQASQN